MKTEPMVGEASLDELHRSLRDPGSAVWRNACILLGERASVCPEAHEELLRLLQCPCRELRLRGTVALAGLARHDAAAASDLVQQFLLDETTWQDPLLADAVYALLPDLPTALAQQLVTLALAPERVIARAALAASLGGWWEWPEDLPLRLASDPSPHVRASLAVSLPHLRGHHSADRARYQLETCNEEWLRKFVEDEFDPPSPAHAASEPGESNLEADSTPGLPPAEPVPTSEPPPAEPDGPVPAFEPEPPVPRATAENGGTGMEEAAGVPPEEEVPVADPLALEMAALSQELLPLLDSREAPMRATARLEAFLDPQGHLVVEALHPLMQTTGILSLLDGLAYLARSKPVGDACRALHRVLTLSRERATRPLQDLEAALQCQQGTHADLLRNRTSAVLEALRVRSPHDMRTWLAHREACGDPMWIPLRDALRGLEFDSGLVALQGVLAEFEQGITPAAEDNCHPWDALFHMVVEAWTEVLDQEIQTQVSGAG